MNLDDVTVPRIEPADIGKAWIEDELHQQRLDSVLYQLARRKLEGLSLYRPMPHVAAFHESRAKWRILDGSNRSGKTFACAVDMAKAWCGYHPNYPKKNAKFLVVGKSQKHLADPMWLKLAEPGAFKIIRDEHTKRWRSVRWKPDDPNELDPYDLAYKEQWKDAPPLLPPRMMADMSFFSKAQGIPEYIRTKRDIRVWFASGDGMPKRGQAWNGVWFDEQLANVQWYYEAVRGLMDYGGRGLWSATLQDCNPQLLELRRRADKGDRGVAGFRLLLRDNPFLSKQEKEEFEASLPDDEKLVRVYGIPAISTRLAYGTFDSQGIHGCDPFEIPLGWTIYMAIDPGRHCGIVMAAVDPDEKHLWVFEAFEIRAKGAHGWAEEIKHRLPRQQLEAIVFDCQAGQQHSMAAESSVEEQTWEALEGAGVVPRLKGPHSGFFPGQKNKKAREFSLLETMRIRPYGVPFSGTPRLRVFRGKCPQLERQIRDAHYDPKRSEKRSCVPEDILDALEYLAAFDPSFRPTEVIPELPPPPIQAETDVKAKRVFESLMEREKRNRATTSGAIF